MDIKHAIFIRYGNRRRDDDTNNQKAAIVEYSDGEGNQMEEKDKNKTNNCVNKAKYIFICNNEKTNNNIIEYIKKEKKIV